MEAENFYSGLVSDHTIITGGHFLFNPDGSAINEGTIKSFYRAALLYSESKNNGKKVALGILINDIGTVCASASGSSSCSIVPTVSKEAFVLPDAYLQILKKLNLTPDEVVVFWEKHMRNRGKKLLLKEIAKQNKHIVPLNGGYIFQDLEKKIEILLTRFHPQDQHGTPACPLIMGAYALAKRELGFNTSVNFYYVGPKNYLNVANHYIIEKGKFVAMQLADCIDVKNIYLFEDCVLSNFERRAI